MKKSLPLIIVITLSILLIFYQFTLIPKHLAFDEVEFAKLALSLDGKPYTPYSPLATGHSTLYFYVLLFSLKVFGVNVFALRLPAAIFGVLSVITFYLIMKILNTKYSILYTLIFLTSRWFLNFSRFSFEPTFLLFLELTAIYFFFNILVYEKTVLSCFLIVGGIFTGLAFNSYTPGRFFFILPLIFVILNLFQDLKKIPNQVRNDKIKSFLYFLIPFIITIIPLTSYFLIHKDTRIDQLFFWRNHEMTIQQKVNGTLQNVSSLTSMFFTKGDMNGRHNYPGKPALNPIMAGLFLFGLIYCVINYKKNLNLFFIAYFLISLAPSTAIYPWENPSMLRTFTVIPSIVYFIGVAINNLSKKKYIFYFLFFILFLSSLYELRTYFKYQVKVFESSFEIKYPLEKAIKMNNPYEKLD